MDKKLILKISITILILLFIGFSTFKLMNAPTFCWDSWDEVNNRMIGGCKPDYSFAVQGLILPFVIFSAVLVTLVIVHFKIGE